MFVSPLFTCKTHSSKYKSIHANENPKEAGVATLISDKTDLKIRTITRAEEEHYVILKEPTQDGDVTVADIRAPSTGAAQCTRQTLTATKGEINSDTVITGLNTPLTLAGRSPRQKVGKEAKPKRYIRPDGLN